MKEFLQRIEQLSDMMARLVTEGNAGATMPEQLKKFEALLAESKATVQVRPQCRLSGPLHSLPSVYCAQDKTS